MRTVMATSCLSGGMMPERVCIAVGSNQDAQANMQSGIKHLTERVPVLAASPVYESSAQGDDSAPPYLNAAVMIETELDPASLKVLLREIEDTQGRIRRLPDGSKSRMVALDFDILLYGQVVGEYGGGVLPHPDILSRSYAVVPLAEIAPDWIHPVTGETITAIAGRFLDSDLELRSDVSLQIPL